ncbi:NAD-dependent succinate-semialdehyde dehydrogenase [Paraburkholderia tuberum]|uniref:Succinate-semialdehyde dehydrogenase / glutarate-semialdehyde dehydrogenase n=1 Tax=Paraburkholderia tuberum TaxID=157910 RepID=A0A1H1KIH0_9BURK|nr:NAD-dependent succinate-semialdehyde dehydrogenase [Paraburkholderia tuberum]SDR62103.1 succinate-semialdehyde dehydrogenase / glutarate-semialdehyde dehydrogenase [Paraburkholderia tuberum]
MELEAHYREHGLLLGGRWQATTADNGQLSINPATEQRLGYMPLATQAQVTEAIDAATEASAAMRKLTPWERSALLRRAATLIRERTPQLARIVALETGKPIAQASGEVNASAESVDWFADEARRVFGMSYESRVKGGRYLVHYEPLGVVAAFTPWNFPLLLLARKMGPALAGGNAIVIRPSNEAAGATMALVRCFVDAGFPEGAINLVIGKADAITPTIMADPRVAKISFTGSVPIGRQIVEMSAKTLKKVTMELGGHAPVIVHRDADIGAFAHLASLGKFRNAGQVCASPTRFYIHESIFDKTVKALVERSESLRVGDPLQQNTDLGPLTTSKRREAIERLVDEAVSEGASVLCGGRRPSQFGRGWFYEPTLVANPAPHLGLMNDEPFGPVGTLTPFTTMDEAITEANRLPFALAAYVFTRSMRNTLETTERLQAGVVGVNTFVASTAETPFGGSKDSGFGREGGPNAIRDYMDTKFINLELANDEPLDATA